MSGIRLGGRAFVQIASPPFSAFEGASGDGDVNVYRALRTDAAGDATAYTSYNDGGTTIEGIHDPVLSPNRSKIAFIGVQAATNLGALYVVNATPGSTPTLLEDDASTWINHPMWSPDSSTIIFTRGNAAGNIYGGTVETIPVTGGTPTVLYTPPAGYRAYRPAFNFDGTRIAFMRTQDAGADDGLWTANDDGTGTAEIVAFTSAGYRLDGPQYGWSPYADRLVYEDGAAAPEVRIINGDGTGSTKINLGAPDGAGNRVGNFPWIAADAVVIASAQGDAFWRLYRCEDDGIANATALSFTNGSANQAWMKQPIVMGGRIWFIEVASGASGGMISSMALDGTGYVEELDVNDATLLADFSGGNGFYYQ